MKVRRRPAVLDAVQWRPDPSLGFFDDDGRYRNRRTGLDWAGVEYTACDVGLHTSQGFMKINPGDWIMTGPDSKRWVCEADCFAALYYEAERSACLSA